MAGHIKISTTMTYSVLLGRCIRQMKMPQLVKPYSALVKESNQGFRKSDVHSSCFSHLNTNNIESNKWNIRRLHASVGPLYMASETSDRPPGMEEPTLETVGPQPAKGSGHRLFKLGARGVSPTRLRGKEYDESDNIQDNVDALATAHLFEGIQPQQQFEEQEEEDFQLYPDETTADALFNGIK